MNAENIKGWLQRYVIGSHEREAANLITVLEKENAELRRDKEQADWREKACKSEAQGYRDDYLRCNKWCCENGFGDSTANAVDIVLTILRLSTDLINRSDSLLRATRHSMDTEKPFPAMLKFTDLINDITAARRKAITKAEGR